MLFTYVIRQPNQGQNPVLPGGIYGDFITIGDPCGHGFNGVQTVAIIFICDGGNFGIDSLSEVTYKGADIAGGDWILHRGTYTKQITPIAIQSVNTTSNVFNSTAHGLNNDDPVRFGVIDGDLPSVLSREVKYYIVNKNTNDFQVSETIGGSAIDLTDAGSGDLIFWLANAGFDDPEQGLPTFAPEANSTFNNIAYVELKIPALLSADGVEPDWEDFRFVGVGRRLMNYDSNGDEIGVVEGDIDLLTNAALVIADNLLVNYKIKHSRIDWESWAQLKAASAVYIWQRAKAGSEDVVSEGMVGRYFSDYDFTNQVLSRNDGTIDFVFTGTSPAPGQPTEWYSIRWNGQLQPDFSGATTLSFNVDDVVILYINGQKIIDNSAGGGSTPSAVYTFESGQVYDVQIDYKQITGPAYIHFYWTPPGESTVIVPADKILSQDIAVRRYSIHAAFPTPTEANEVHERFMERCPGWDWTDDNGLIKFLGPDRPIAFNFKFDKVDDDSKANWAKGSFSKKRRPISDRKNSLLGSFRNVLLTGYPLSYCDADREDLRNYTNGQPDNDAPIDLGVSNRSLAERVLEDKMVFTSDPRHLFSLATGRKNSHIKKNFLGTISYYDRNGEYVADETVIATFVSQGASNSKRDINLTPIKVPFYTDEPVSGDIPDVDVTPTDVHSELL